MVKFQERSNGPNTVAYYLGDARLSEDERTGVWLGNGCRLAGIPEYAQVTAEDFQLVLEGWSPRGDRLFSQQAANRRSCWDCTVTAEKSISVAALCSQTDAGTLTREAFSATIEKFVVHLESLAYRQDNGRPFIPTGNLVIAKFVHESSRHADPHLHAHLCLMNTTRGPGDFKWRSLETLPLYKQQTALKMVFNALLVRSLLSRGLPAYLDREDGLAKLPVPKPICIKLSKAHMAIVAMAEEIEGSPLPSGWDDLPHAALVARLNERTRPKTRPEKPYWPELLNPEEQRAVDAALELTSPVVYEERTAREPLVLLKEKLASTSIFLRNRTVRGAVKKVAAEHPTIPLGEFTRASERISAERKRHSNFGSNALLLLQRICRRVTRASALLARKANQKKTAA